MQRKDGHHDENLHRACVRVNFLPVWMEMETGMEMTRIFCLQAPNEAAVSQAVQAHDGKKEYGCVGGWDGVECSSWQCAGQRFFGAAFREHPCPRKRFFSWNGSAKISADYAPLSFTFNIPMLYVVATVFPQTHSTACQRIDVSENSRT